MESIVKNREFLVSELVAGSHEYNKYCEIRVIRIFNFLLQRSFVPNVQGVKYSSEAKSPICGSLIVRFWRFSSVYGRLPTWRHGFLRLSHYDDHHLQLWKGAEKFKAGPGRSSMFEPSSTVNTRTWKLSTDFVTISRRHLTPYLSVLDFF